MSETQNITTEEVDKFKSFMDTYSKEIGAATGFVGELLTDKFIKDLLETAKRAGLDQSKYASSLQGLNVQTSLLGLQSASKTLASMLKAGGPAVAVLGSIYNGWNGDNISGELAKTVTTLAVGAWVGSIFALTTFPAAVPIALAAVAGYYIDKYWDDGIDKLSDGFACLFEKFLFSNKDIDIQMLQSTVTTAESHPSPLVLDLDGDGVETDKEDSSIHFDHDNNGFAESSGWAGKDDGLLVRDINSNGQIDNGTELFGDNTVLSNGQKAANGFEALKDLDSNNDGVFNSSDAAWNEVKVWRDANGNGVVDENELLTLEQAGVSGINLDYQNTNTTDGNGNQHNQSGTFIKTDGTTGAIHDVWFDADKADTVDKIEVDISDEIKALPEIQGFGNVHSLQTAMVLDTTGALKALIEQYAAETDVTVRRGMINNIIFHWTGVQDIDPESRKPSYFYDNPIQDARYLEALERFLGEKYSNKWWFGQEEQNPHEQASNILLKAFDQLSDYVMVKLEEQTHYKGLIEDIKMTWNVETQVWDIDVSQAVVTLNSIMEQNFARGIDTLHNLEKIIQQQDILSEYIIAAFQNSGIDCTTNLRLYLLNFGKFENYISEGNDIIYGNAGNNIINGLSGNDKIYGSAGNDTLIGGEGNDYLVGGEGSDTYFFEGSWGHDSIDNSSADEKGAHPDKILFGDGILPSDVTIQRQGNDLILSLHNGADTIKVYSYFLDAGATTNTVDTIEFADGTTWNYEYVRVAWNSAPVSIGGYATISGTKGNDTIYGTSGVDFISGEAGNDTIYANNGNDVIYGGAGNDTLNGGSGNDLYIWNWGDGFDTIYDSGNNDTISFGPGITFNDLTFSNIGENLKIVVKNNETQGILIKDFMRGVSYKIEELSFYDGSSVHLSEIGLTLQQTNDTETIKGTEFGDTIYANGGDDTINAGAGDDTIYGGAGCDKIYGDVGNDTIYGGDGNDTIDAGSGNNVIYGGKGDDNIKASHGSDTYFWNMGDGLDTIEDRGYELNDTLVFGEGITFEDLKFTQISSDKIKVTVKGDETQGLLLVNLLPNSNKFGVDILKFADGTTVNMKEQGITLHQNDSNETISGTIFDDVIYGEGGNDVIKTYEGNDTIYGGDGNDTIDAGSGNNIIYGGKGDDNIKASHGSDTYFWNMGDGLDTIEDRGYELNDTLVFGEGITFEDLKFTQISSDKIKVTVKGDETQGLLLVNLLPNSNKFGVDILKFADGTTVNMKEQGITLHQNDSNETISGTIFDDVIYGEGGNDTINAREGNDTLIGGVGNDTLNGGNGNDIYVYSLGDGFDTITETGGNDKIVFGEGISQNDLSFEKIGNHLKISINGDEIKGIQINDHFYYDRSKVETIEFHDGSTLDISNADQLIQAMNSFSISNSASTDTLSNPTQDVSDMYSLVANSDLSRKAI